MPHELGSTLVLWAGAWGVAILVALVGSLVVPQWGSWWLVLLFLAGPADKIVAAVAPRR